MNFKFFGMRAEVCFYTLAASSILLMLDRSGIAAMCILFAALHEAGHIIALKIFHCAPAKIKITPGGIKISDTRLSVRSFKNEIIAALSGPAVNIICSILFYILWKTLCRDSFLLAAAVSLVIGLFNLLPIFPLDGGRVLCSLMSLKTDPTTAQRIVTAVSAAILLPAAVVGFILLLKSGYNVTLLFTCFYLAYLLIKQ